MNKTRNNEFKEALKNGRLFDYISNSCNQFSKSELADIIKEFDYLIYTKLGEEETLNIEKELINALEENTYVFAEEEE